jgi:hypothetical protein
VTTYCTRVQVKQALRIDPQDNLDDLLLDQSISAASRMIDGYCGRNFYSTGTAEARVFSSKDPFVCYVDDLAGTAITLQSSTLADNNFDVTWKASDYQLEPLNGRLDGLVWSYYRIRAVGDYLFPTLNAAMTEQALVKVTAVFGWAAVPDAVEQACIIQSSRLFKRFDSPLGVAGFGDLGAVRVSRYLDPDVEQLVEPYRLMRMFA